MIVHEMTVYWKSSVFTESFVDLLEASDVLVLQELYGHHHLSDGSDLFCSISGATSLKDNLVFKWGTVWEQLRQLRAQNYAHSWFREMFVPPIYIFSCRIMT